MKRKIDDKRIMDSHNYINVKTKEGGREREGFGKTAKIDIYILKN